MGVDRLSYLDKPDDSSKQMYLQYVSMDVGGVQSEAGHNKFVTCIDGVVHRQA